MRLAAIDLGSNSIHMVVVEVGPTGGLRVADALDRSHRRPVRRLRVVTGGRAVQVRCEVTGNAELEGWGVARRADLLEKVLGRPVRFDLRAGRRQRARAAAS